MFYKFRNIGWKRTLESWNYTKAPNHLLQRSIDRSQWDINNGDDIDTDIGDDIDIDNVDDSVKINIF